MNHNFMSIIIILMISILIAIFSINQISAEEAVCCERTISGAWCNDAPQEDCATGTNPLTGENYRTNTNACDATTFCQTGYCFDPNEGLCGDGSPKMKCEVEGGEWSRNENINLCQEGCCFLGENTDYMTEARCQILAEKRGYEFNFDVSLSERECRFFSQKEGACLVNENTCGVTTDENCIKNLGGEFFEGRFCSDTALNLSYKKHSNKICHNGDIYWTDDGGNREDLFKDCLDRKEICATNANGDLYCKSLQCFDEENNKQRVNGESWCRYDSYVGEFDYTTTEIIRRFFLTREVEVTKSFSADTIGSEYYLLVCEDGVIEPKGYSDKRDMVCVEKIDPVTGISEAKLRQNLAQECLTIDSIEECSDHSDCKVQSVNLGEQFNFEVCVPKYPPGRKFFENGFGISCVAAYDNGGNCIANCECRTDDPRYDPEENYEEHVDGTTDIEDYNIFTEDENPKFIAQLNNLCISFGDYGTYINYAGNKTENMRFIGGGEGGYKFCKENFEKGIYYETCKDYRKIYDENYKEVLTRPNVIGNNTPSNILTSLRTRATNIPTYPKILNLENWADYVGREESDVEEDDDIHEIYFICLPWEPLPGGDDCEKCNEDPLAKCTEYRCENLGAACGILPETVDSDNPICVDRYCRDEGLGSPGNPAAPQISFKSVKQGYKFENASRGVFIKTSSGSSVEKNSDIFFTLETDVLAKCVLSVNASNALSELDRTHDYNTTHSFNVKVNVDERMGLTVLCQDICGDNNRLNEYLIAIPVSPEPDRRDLDIDRFIPESGSFLKYGETKSDLEIVLSEPADCKYDRIPNIAYESMTSKMMCNKKQTNALRSTCFASLTGLTEPENNIYIRCNDTSGNINTRDAVYTLFATPSPLMIDSTYPENETIIKKPISKSNPLVLEVKTSGGAYNGVSSCGYKFLDKGWSDDFTETDSTIHKYSILNLSAGTYRIEITCEDKAGNVAASLSEFKVDIDKTPPIVVRVFHDTTTKRLKLITNEDARCYYNNIEACSPFLLDSKRSMTTAFSKTHSAAWDEGKTYYIKCEDFFGNTNPSCAIIVKPSQ